MIIKRFMDPLIRGDAVEMGRARAPRAVFRALAEHRRPGLTVR